MIQLGITDAVLNGTANESEMNNYIKRTVEPICAAFCDEMKRKWLTQTARTKGQSIVYYSDPFKLIPINEIAKFADVLSRNEIMTSNEIRQKMGMPPSDDPGADELNNANMPDYPTEEMTPMDQEANPEMMETPEQTEEPFNEEEVYFDPTANNQNGESSDEGSSKTFSLFK